MSETGPRILLVDDNPRVREALGKRITLSAASYYVDTAASGEEALELLRQDETFDIVVCDLTLSGKLDGVGVIRAIVESHPATRVVVYSGLDDGSRKVEVLKAGAFSYLSKPINFDELLHTIALVDSIRRTERLQRRSETLTRISFDLQASFDFHRLTRRILAGALELGYTRARLYLLDHERQMLVGQEAMGMPAGFDLASYRIPLAESPLAHLMSRADRPRLWDLPAIMQKFGEKTEPWLMELGLDGMTWIDCPLMVRDRRIGTLAVDQVGSGQRLTAEDLQTLGLFSSLAAQSLDNSRLYEREALANASLRSVLEEAPDVLMITDMAGKIDFVSPSSERVLGLTPEQMLGRRVENFYTDEKNSAEAGQRIASQLMMELEKRETISNRRVQLQLGDKASRPISISLSLLHNELGEALGTLGIIKDLGPFEAQSQQYRDLLEGFGYGTLLLDRQGKIIFTNRKAERLLQRSGEDLLGHSLATFVPSTEAADLEDHLQRVLTEEAETGHDLVLVQPGGGRAAVHARLTPVRREHSPDTVAVAFHDKSELAAIVQSGRLMAMGQMVAGVAHEINNPLNNMLLAANELEDAVTGTTARMSTHVEIIQRNGLRIRDIVRQLRELSRPSDFTLGPESVNAIVEASVGFFATRLRNDNIEFELELAPDLPDAQADAPRLQQVLVNLIINAEEAMAEQDGEKRLILSSRLLDSGRLQVTVCDTGPGIPEKVRESIFDPFVTTKSPSQGTGLGLSICKKIMDSHHGTIRAENRCDGNGTCFHLELPTASQPAKENP